MKIQLIRNAMIKITCGGVTFLVDPWLAEKGNMGTFRQLRAAGMDFSPVVEEQWDIPMPMCALPFQRETILAGVDAYIVTHLHPDHVDMTLDGTVGAPLDHSVPLFVQSADPTCVSSRRKEPISAACASRRRPAATARRRPAARCAASSSKRRASPSSTPRAILSGTTAWRRPSRRISPA